MNIPASSCLKNIFSRETYVFDDKKPFSAKKWYLLGGLAIYIVIMFFRSWSNFTQPGLYVEDSIHYFNLFYGAIRPIGDIFAHPNGYYNIHNNLVAFFTAKADILIQPLIYQSFATFLCIVAVAAVSFSGLLQNRFILLISPVLLGLSGMNHIYYYITLTFQMYLVIVILLVLLLWQKNSIAILDIPLFLLLAFLIWSGPYSVLAVPFCFAFLFLFKGKTWMFVSVLAVTVAYSLSVEKSTIMLGNLFDYDILYIWFHTMMTKVFYMGMKDSVNTERVLLLIAIFIPLLTYLRNEKFYLKITLLLFIIIVSSFAPLFLSKKYLLYQTVYPCHYLIAQFFYLIFILYSFDKLLAKINTKYEGKVGVLFIVAVCSFILLDNIEHRDKWETKIMTNMPLFLQTVKEAEELHLEEKGEHMVIIAEGNKGNFKPVAIVGDRSKASTRIKRIYIPVTK